MLQAARSAKKKLLYVRFVQIKSDPENTIPTIAFGIEGLSNFNASLIVRNKFLRK